MQPNRAQRRAAQEAARRRVAPKAMMHLIRRFVNAVVDDFDYNPLSRTELASVQETCIAIEHCLASAQSQESLVEMTRILIHNGIAGGYVDRYQE